eukprot:8447302-Pyramimonas_sp.AAC.1
MLNVVGRAPEGSAACQLREAFFRESRTSLQKALGEAHAIQISEALPMDGWGGRLPWTRTLRF